MCRIEGAVVDLGDIGDVKHVTPPEGGVTAVLIISLKAAL